MSLPLNKTQAKEAAFWMRQHFDAQIREVVAGTPWNVELIIAIACQETAYKWLHWIKDYSPEVILARCVFDTSGEPEFPDAPRSAFPKTRFDFVERYGTDFLKMLVEESNKTRRMQGWHDAPYLCRGYGIFQYDLQHVLTDREWFEQKRWYSLSECLVKLVAELNVKAQAKSTLHDIVKAYNGAGQRAETYANNVLTFANWV